MSSVFYMAYRLINVYETLIVVRCILTWVPTRRGTLLDDVTTALATLVDPYLDIFRRLIPQASGMGVDFSPIVAMFALEAISRLVLRLVM